MIIHLQIKRGGRICGGGGGGLGLKSPLQVPFLNHEIIFYYFFNW